MCKLCDLRRHGYVVGRPGPEVAVDLVLFNILVQRGPSVPLVLEDLQSLFCAAQVLILNEVSPLIWATVPCVSTRSLDHSRVRKLQRGLGRTEELTPEQNSLASTTTTLLSGHVSFRSFAISAPLIYATSKQQTTLS